MVLACALAESDEYGFFGASDVRLPEEDVDPAGYLDSLSASEHGGLLQRRGVASPRYRFVNPLLQPYVLMRGLAEGRVAPELLQALAERGAQAGSAGIRAVTLSPPPR